MSTQADGLYLQNGEYFVCSICGYVVRRRATVEKHIEVLERVKNEIIENEIEKKGYILGSELASYHIEACSILSYNQLGFGRWEKHLDPVKVIMARGDVGIPYIGFLDEEDERFLDVFAKQIASVFWENYDRDGQNYKRRFTKNCLRPFLSKKAVSLFYDKLRQNKHP